MNRPSILPIKSLLRLIVIVTLSACCLASASASASEVNELTTAIERLPPWAFADRDKFESLADEYAHVGGKFQSLSVQDARLVVGRVVEKMPKENFDLETASKLYVLMRFYFAVPESIKRSEYRAFGGGWGVPVDDEDRLGTLWPLVLDKGELRLTHQFRLFKGANYRPLDEFDHFQKNFGPRERPVDNK